MRSVTLSSIVLAVFLTGCSKTPRFQNVTIQVHEPNPFDEMAPSFHFGRFVAQDQTLLDLIAFAYQVTPSQVSGPDVIRRTAFNMFAEVPKDAKPEQLPAMLRVELEERFKLVAHSESKIRDFYVLTVAPGGPKFKEAPQDPEYDPGEPENFDHSVPLRSSMSRWAQVLTQLMDHPVLDRTGLNGKYTANLGLNLNGDPFAETRREVLAQLGLNLEPRKEVLPIVVVEKAEAQPVKKGK
jgi:uncharacterized protein (TIGR03435 family)